MQFELATIAIPTAAEVELQRFRDRQEATSRSIQQRFRSIIETCPPPEGYRWAIDQSEPKQVPGAHVITYTLRLEKFSGQLMVITSDLYT